MNEHRDNGTYLGFWKDKEYYYRFGEVKTFKIGTFLVALTDAALDEFEADLQHVAKQVVSMEIENDEDCTEVFVNFSCLFNKIYKYLYSLNLILGDCFLLDVGQAMCGALHTLHPLKPNPSSALIAGSDLYQVIECKRDAILPLMFDSNKLNPTRFSIDGFNCFLSNFKNGYDKLDAYIAHYIIKRCALFIASIKNVRTALLQIIPVTLVRDESAFSSILKYKNILDKFGFNKRDDDTKYALFSDSEKSMHRAVQILGIGYNRRISTFSKIIHVDTEDTFDENQGYRLISALHTIKHDSHATIIADLACLEFEFLCANNIDIVKCKNCGRYFLPLTSASNFCDRPLKEDPTRICKSLSSQWYADNKRSNNPAWDEYMVYRSRYNSRTYRNKAKNPKDRLDHWNKQARQLFQDYDSGKITREEFSSTLAEMDKDMKPLDEM